MDAILKALQEVVASLTLRLRRLEAQEFANVDNTSYIDILTATYTLTAVATDIPNWTLDLTEGTYLVALSAIIDTGANNNDNGQSATLVLRANGVNQTGTIVAPLVYLPPDLRNRLSVGYVWRYTVPTGDTHTLTVRASKSGGTGVSIVEAGNLVTIRET